MAFSDLQLEHVTSATAGRTSLASQPSVGLGWAAAAAGLALAVLVGSEGSPAWRLGRVLGVAGLTAFVVLAVRPRAGERRRGRVAVLAAVPALAIAIGFVPYVLERGGSVRAWATALLMVAGGALAVAGTVSATAGRGAGRRLGTAVGIVAVVAVVAFVVAPAVAATNVPRPALGTTPDAVGLPFEDAVVTTHDGIELAGWYVPSSNRAAVVLLHGAGSTRSDVLDQASVLARAGFGVLMIDARGHGASGGRAMDFGWDGDADITAATEYLAGRTDVDADRIGVVGLSMGGEQAIGASAANGRIRAVVAEGATARVAADEAWLSDEYGLRGWIQERLETVQDWVTDALTAAAPPASMRAAVERAQHTSYLLIVAGDVADEGRAAAFIAGGAPDRVAVWTVDGAGHTGGLTTAPDERAATVTAFLDRRLRPTQ